MSKEYFENEEQNNLQNKELISNNGQEISDLSPREILRFFDSLSAEKRQILIPIGFPQAGKSFFLSSLLWYSQKNKAKLFTAKPVTRGLFGSGSDDMDRMVSMLESGEAFASNIVGTISTIGINLTKKGSSKDLRLAIVDLPGEDLKNVKRANGAFLPDKIEAILKACDRTGATFCLITPYIPKNYDLRADGMRSDKQEDELHNDFLNYLYNNHSKLYKNSNYIVLVTQWDNLDDPDIKEVEDYISEYRPSIYNRIKADNLKILYGEYSVGDVEEIKDTSGIPVVHIRNQNKFYPKKFWSALYLLLTGSHMEPRGFWTRLKNLFR